MSVICIQGSRRLEGTVKIQGSKNAVLPVMAASLLHRGVVTLTNVPRIQDVFCMTEILEYLGCACRLAEHTLVIDTREACGEEIPEEMARRMRSSIMLMGPMLGRFGRAVTVSPGGCTIGQRPIDLHLEGLRRLGAEVRVDGEQITALAGKLAGSEIRFRYPSVGATENALMAAVLADGDTVIKGAAREPEIVTLCAFLTAMGASIEGAGTKRLTVRSGRALHDADFVIPGDRIVAGTYLGAVLAAGGKVRLQGALARHLEEPLRLARSMGARVNSGEDGFSVRMDRRPAAVGFTTGPYPKFPTDLQSVMMAAACVADGTTRIRETVFEDRFSTAGELRKMGGHIVIRGRTAVVAGTDRLSGAQVAAKDLRGGAALVVAGLAACGRSEICGCRYIERGYEDICRDLGGIGADIGWKE